MNGMESDVGVANETHFVEEYQHFKTLDAEFDLYPNLIDDFNPSYYRDRHDYFESYTDSNTVHN